MEIWLANYLAHNPSSIKWLHNQYEQLMGNRAKQTLLRGCGITLLSVCLSVGLTALWYELDTKVTREDILLVAILIPMICAPLCTYIGMKSRLKMEALALENARIANTDALTGLSNRRAFFDRVKSLSQAPDEPPGPVTYFVCDIDHFKHFNDQHGHATGDAVLSHVAKLIREALPQRALIARIGGEEPVRARGGRDQLPALRCAAPLCRGARGAARGRGGGLVPREPPQFLPARRRDLLAGLLLADDLRLRAPCREGERAGE